MSSARLLLFCPQMKPVAEDLRLEWSNRHIKLGVIDWRQFPDGFPNLFIKNVDDVRSSDVAFLASFDSPGTIFEQFSVMQALAELSPRSLRILLPYFPTGTMERVDVEGQIATASTLARLLSSLPPAGPGPIPLYMWDVHVLQIRHYFGPNISLRFKSAMKLLKKQLPPNQMIAFPDDGARKRFSAMFSVDGTPEYDFVICRKVRQGGNRIVTIGEGDPAGRDVVIVDDLIHSGGTIIECMKALKAAGAAKVSAHATHGVFDNDAWKNFVDAGFERVYVSDTFPSARNLDDKGQFTVLKLTQSMINAILD